MPEEPTEIGRFAFGIRVLKHDDGRVELKTQSFNESIPQEMIIMQLKAFLRNLENDYFDNYDENTSRFKNE